MKKIGQVPQRTLIAELLNEMEAAGGASPSPTEREAKV